MKKVKEIEIEGIKYKVAIGFGVMMEFEEATGKNITDIKGKKDIMKLAYWALRYNNENFKYEYKQFVDEVLDSNVSLFIEIIQIITELLFGNNENSEGINDKKK